MSKQSDQHLHSQGHPGVAPVHDAASGQGKGSKSKSSAGGAHKDSGRKPSPPQDYHMDDTSQASGGVPAEQEPHSPIIIDGSHNPLIPQHPVAVKCADNVTDSVWGTIFGNCIGDAIGLLTEFMGQKQAQDQYGKAAKKGGLEYEQKLNDRHRRRWKTGDWTDDSDQMILIMKSLVDNKGEVNYVDYGHKVKYWAYNGFKELGDKGGCGLGATTFQVLEHEQFNKDPHAASKQVWITSGCQVAPNGGVMRTSPAGIYQYYDPELVKKNTLDFCRVTHADHRCEASCIAVTTAISLMLQRNEAIMNSDGSFNTWEITQAAYKAATKHFDELAYASNILTQEHRDELQHYMFCEDIRDLRLAEDAKIGYTYKSMGSGFWALRQDDFRNALTAITMEAGDADTNGAVAGAMLGCKLGYWNLVRNTESWVMELRHRKWLINEVESFLKVVNKDLKNKGFKMIGSCPTTTPSGVPSQEGLAMRPPPAAAAQQQIKSQTVNIDSKLKHGGSGYVMGAGAPPEAGQIMPEDPQPKLTKQEKERMKQEKKDEEKKLKEDQRKLEKKQNEAKKKGSSARSGGPSTPSPTGDRVAASDGKHITAPSVNNQEYYHLNEFISGTDHNVTPVLLTPNTQLAQPEYSQDEQQKRRKHSSQGSDASPTPSPMAPITPSYPATSQPSHQSYAPAPQHAYSQGPYYHGQPQAGHQPYSPGGQVYPTGAPQGHTPGYQQGYHQQQNHPGQAYPPTAQHGYTQDQNLRSHLQSPQQVNSPSQQGDHFTYPEQHGGYHPQTQQPPRTNKGQYQHPQIQSQPQHGADGPPAVRPKIHQSRSQEDGAFQRGNVSREPQSSRPILTVQGHAYNERSVDGPVTPSAGQKPAGAWHETTPKTPTTPNDPSGGKRISKDDSDVKLSSEMSFDRGHKARWSFRVSGRKKKNNKENILASPQVQQEHAEARNESQFDRTTPLRKSKADLKKEKKENKEKEKEQRRRDALARNAADQDNEHSEKKKKKAACVIS